MHASRVARVAENLRRMNLKQALISAPASLFYLTGKWITPGERMVALYINDQGDTRLYANRLFALRGNIDAELIEYDDTQDCVRILADGLQSGPIGIDKNLRNDGLGSILLDFAQQEMVKRGIYHMFFISTDEPGRRYYERKGVRVYRHCISYKKDLEAWEG